MDIAIKQIAWLLAALMLSGCDYFKPAPMQDWQLAPKQYKCEIAQMTKVESEAKWCNDNTTYFSDYCYGTAIIRNCSKVIYGN